MEFPCCWESEGVAGEITLQELSPCLRPMRGLRSSVDGAFSLCVRVTPRVKVISVAAPHEEKTYPRKGAETANRWHNP